MKLHWSPKSPYVRKVMMVAHETGLVERLELVRSVALMTQPNPTLMNDNPLSKIPTLVLESGQALFDSAVICEYLDCLHSGPRLFPESGDARWQALRRHALGDGLLDVLILWRNERERAPPQQSPVLLAAFELKTHRTLALLEHEADVLASTAFGIGHIAIGCALGYCSFRFPNLPWGATHPRLAGWLGMFEQRPAALKTAPHDDL
jgi:glutathione S-transferase